MFFLVGVSIIHFHALSFNSQKIKYKCVSYPEQSKKEETMFVTVCVALFWEKAGRFKTFPVKFIILFYVWIYYEFENETSLRGDVYPAHTHMSLIRQVKKIWQQKKFQSFVFFCYPSFKMACKRDNWHRRTRQRLFSNVAHTWALLGWLRFLSWHIILRIMLVYFVHWIRHDWKSFPCINLQQIWEKVLHLWWKFSSFVLQVSFVLDLWEMRQECKCKCERNMTGEDCK